MNTHRNLLLVLTCLTGMAVTACSSDDDDDGINGSNGNMQNRSLTQLVNNNCDRMPENEQPSSVIGLAYEGNPDSETALADRSGFSNNCI